MPIFSWSAWSFGSTATEITGSGNSMRSSVMMSLQIDKTVAGGDVFEADRRGNVARIALP